MADSFSFALDAFADDGTLRFAQGDIEILLVKTNDQVKAYRGVCPHLGGPMLECRRSGDALVCPWHDYVFRASDGLCQTVPGSKWRHSHGIAQARNEPMAIRLTPLECRVEGNTVTVTLKA